MTGFANRLAARATGAAGGLRAVPRSRFEGGDSAAFVETTEETEAPPQAARTPAPAPVARPPQPAPPDVPRQVTPLEPTPRVANPPSSVGMAPPPPSLPPAAPQPIPARPTRVARDPDREPRVTRPVAAAHELAPRAHPVGSVPASRPSSPATAPKPPPERQVEVEIESHVIQRQRVERVADPKAAGLAADPPGPAQPSAQAPAPAPAPAPQAVPEPPVVEVTIGRIEVTARSVVPPVTSVPAAQPPPPGPRLEEYLAERSRS